MVEPPPDALEIADPVAVAVLERARIDLVDDGALPPMARAVRGCHAPRSVPDTEEPRDCVVGMKAAATP